MMKKLTYNEIDSKLDETMAWLQELDIDSDLKRLTNIKETIRELSTVWKDEKEKRELIKTNGISQLLWTLLEAQEFINACQQIKNIDDIESVKLKIREAFIKGPKEPKFENSNTNFGRNIMFELNLAGKLNALGYKVKFDKNTDLICDNKELLIQCKRPLNIKNINKNLAAANEQLIKDLNALKENKSRGIIAISISRVLNDGNSILLINNNENIDKVLYSQMNKITKNYSNKFNRNKDKRIIGVLFHFITIAAIRNTDFPFNAEYIGLSDLSTNKDDKAKFTDFAERFNGIVS